VCDVDDGVVGQFVGMRWDLQIHGRSWRFAFDPLPSVVDERQGRLVVGIAYLFWLYLDGAFFDLYFVRVGSSRGRTCFLKQGLTII